MRLIALTQCWKWNFEAGAAPLCAIGEAWRRERFHPLRGEFTPLSLFAYVGTMFATLTINAK